MIIRIQILALLFFFQTLLSTALAEGVRIAVATNFLSTLKEVIANFEQDTDHTAVISSGSQAG